MAKMIVAMRGRLQKMLSPHGKLGRSGWSEALKLGTKSLEVSPNAPKTHP